MSNSKFISFWTHQPIRRMHWTLTHIPTQVENAEYWMRTTGGSYYQDE